MAGHVAQEPANLLLTVYARRRQMVRLAGEAERAKSGVGGPGSLPKTLVAPSKTEMLGALMGVAPGVVAIPMNEKSLVGSHAPELAIRN